MKAFAGLGDKINGGVVVYHINTENLSVDFLG